MLSLHTGFFVLKMSQLVDCSRRGVMSDFHHGSSVQGSITGLGRIPVIANLCLAFASFYAFLGNYFFSGLSIFAVIFFAFGVVFLAVGYWIRKGGRGAVAASIASAAVLLILSLPILPEFITEPTNFPTFAFAVFTPPLVILSVLSSFVAWREARPGRATVSRQSGFSAMLAFGVVGFIIGGLLIGGLAAGTESRLIAGSGTSADVTIVVGAAGQGNPLPYSPSPYTVKVGSTVTWVNKDTSTHTVTSIGSSLFDSGNILPGGSYSFTFTQAGTYQYYCTIHPWMKGTIIVTNG